MKNVTKKAKYKVSNKNVTVSKKGKITAKKAGTSTVTVTYKKKAKKIKVTVKTNTVTTEETTTEAETKKKSKKMASPEEIAQYQEECKIYSDPKPDCSHEWEDTLYQSPDVYIRTENFATLYKDHLVLKEVQCVKCHLVAVTSPVPVTEAIDYTSEQLASVILYYPDSMKCGRDEAPKHKCKRVCGWIPPTDSDPTWFADDRCAICDELLDVE